MIRLWRAVWRATACVAVGVAPAAAQRLSAASGKVLNDITDKPIAGAEVSIPGLSLRTTSDSTGAFRLNGVPGGKQIIWVRKIGFSPISAVLTFVPGETLANDFGLVPAVQELPKVAVTGEAVVHTKLSEFEDRRKEGFGHFLTEKQLEKMGGRQMSEVLATIPGPTMLRGTGNVVWVVGGRGPVSILRNGAGELTKYDRDRGAKKGLCYSAVVVDGIFVYSGNDGEMLFDINSIPPTDIAGVEVYTSTATLPTKYNGTRAACGLIIIWTKI